MDFSCRRVDTVFSRSGFGCSLKHSKPHAGEEGADGVTWIFLTAELIRSFLAVEEIESHGFFSQGS